MSEFKICMVLLAMLMSERPGGIFGAIYIGASIVIVPRVGVATFIGFLVAGQMIASVIIDHFGLLGLPPNLAGFARVLGAIS